MSTSSDNLSRASVVLACALALAPVARAQSRGELLYSTHCIACHTTEVHWRDKKMASDLRSLEAQVRRWQGTNSLGWNDADILEVARYLNRSYYHFATRARTM